MVVDDADLVGLLVVGALVIVAQTSEIAPFIDTLF